MAESGGKRAGGMSVQCGGFEGREWWWQGLLDVWRDYEARHQHPHTLRRTWYAPLKEYCAISKSARYRPNPGTSSMKMTLEGREGAGTMLVYESETHCLL